MSLKKVLKNLDFRIPAEDLKKLNEEANFLIKGLKESLKRKKVNAEIFVGGSFGKETLARSEKYDVDIFVRFDKKEKNISEILEKIVEDFSKRSRKKYERVHGSRDYFKFGAGNAELEVVPVLKISSPSQAENVTDLSYFHVRYVKKKTNENMRKEISLAKAFCKAQGVYGAESYIRGFSGYGIECLVIYYKSFEKMLRAILKEKGKIIIDPEKQYKNRRDILIELNESKIKSPIVLIDPTWKERNVLSALDEKTFEKFKNAAAEFLKNPSVQFFYKKDFSVEDFKKKFPSKEILKIEIESDRQEGDIAGTKMRKFSEFLFRECEKNFEILESKFVYSGAKQAEIFFVIGEVKKRVKEGPLESDKKNLERFKKKNKKIFFKNGRAYAEIEEEKSAEDFLKKFKIKEKKRIGEMSIVDFRVTRI